MQRNIVNGFSKLTKEEKIESLSGILNLPMLNEKLKSFWHNTNQQLFDEFSENSISNYYLPYSIAPNFLINETICHIPMVTEESSVVAALQLQLNFGFIMEVLRLMLYLCKNPAMYTLFFLVINKFCLTIGQCLKTCSIKT